MKKIISIILALTLVLALSVTAFAAADGSITVNSVAKGNTYSIYRLLDLETFVKDAAYSYKVNAAWTAFFAQPEMATYLTVDGAGYVTWVGAEDDATMAAFAKKALAYAKANGIAPVDSVSIADDYAGTSYKFENLELGWYLVDSTAGALCGLTTTDKDAVINAKNHVPTIDKKVQEDLTGEFGGQNTADIGQIVNYRSIIHVAAGAENYTVHDTMSDGLTFVHDTVKGRGVVKIEHVNNSSVHATLVEGTHYTVKSTCSDGCTFEIEFKEDFIKTLLPNERIIIDYNAMLNRHAVVAGDGNPNTIKLEYGENNYTVPSFAKTYTFSFSIVKTTTSNTLLEGAKFRIYDAATGGNEVAVVPLLAADDLTPVLDANGNPKYRRARADETGVEIDVLDGVVTIVGFDNGIYYLEETKAPEGYNKLTGRQQFIIADANNEAEFSGGIWSTGSGVHVVNKTGTMLPETGATGTMLFITMGMVLVLCAGVLLVTKKRVAMIRE